MRYLAVSVSMCGKTVAPVVVGSRSAAICLGPWLFTTTPSLMLNLAPCPQQPHPTRKHSILLSQAAPRPHARRRLHSHATATAACHITRSHNPTPTRPHHQPTLQRAPQSIVPPALPAAPIRPPFPPPAVARPAPRWRTHPSCCRRTPLKRKPSTGETLNFLNNGMTTTVAPRNFRKSSPSGSKGSAPFRATTSLPRPLRPPPHLPPPGCRRMGHHGMSMVGGRRAELRPRGPCRPPTAPARRELLQPPPCRRPQTGPVHRPGAADSVVSGRLLQREGHVGWLRAPMHRPGS